MIGITWMMLNGGMVEGSGGGLASTAGAHGSSIVWWDVGAAVFMLLFPLGMALLIPAVKESDPARWRGLLLWLIGLTVAAVGGWGAWWIATGSMLRSWWLWGVYPVLLLLAIVVTNRKREDPAVMDAESVRAQGIARTASLSVRRGSELGVASWAWWIAGTVAVALIAAAGARFVVEFADRGELIRAWTGLGMAVIGLGEVVLFAWMVQRVLPREGRTLDPGGSAELMDGYERMSRLRARGFYVFGCVMAVVFGGAGVMMAWIGAGDGRALGIIGSAVGGAVGLAGGVFGIWCSIRGMRLQDRRLELTRGAGAGSAPSS